MAKTGKPIPFARLLDWIEGRLPEEEARKVAEEVDVADYAAVADLEWLRLFEQVQASVVLRSMPPEVQRAIARRLHGAGVHITGAGPLLVAALVFDSAAHLIAGGLRSGGGSTSRQLVFAAGTAEIALNVHRRFRDIRVDVDGQVFASDGSANKPCEVHLLQDINQVLLTNTDDLGEFSFEAVPPDDYSVLINGQAAGTILVPVQVGL